MIKFTTLSHVQFDETEERGVYHLTAIAVFRGANPQADQAVFLEKLGGNLNVKKLETTQY